MLLRTSRGIKGASLKSKFRCSRKERNRRYGAWKYCVAVFVGSLLRSVVANASVLKEIMGKVVVRERILDRRRDSFAKEYRAPSWYLDPISPGHMWRAMAALAGYRGLS